MCTTALGSFLLHPAECQSLSCLKVEMQTQAVFQTLPQSTLVTGRLLDQELQILTYTAPGKHAHALGHHYPRAFDSPCPQENTQRCKNWVLRLGRAPRHGLLAEVAGVEAHSPLLAGGHVLVVAAVGSGTSAASLVCRSAGCW
jgi:hypothetical protein